MSDPQANIPAQAPPAGGPANSDPNVQQPTPEQQPADPASVRDDIRQQLVTWGEELKQQLTTALDQKLDELGTRLQSFGG